MFRDLFLKLMLSSHLPRAPCDKFVYNFSGHRRWLRATAYMCSHCLRASCNFLYGPWGQAGVNPYRDCTEIVHLSGVAVQSPQPLDGNRAKPVPCGFRAEAVRKWCRDGAVTVWRHHAVCERAASARCPVRGFM